MKESHVIRCGDKTLDVSTPAIMGILNLTPDSYYDGGWYSTKESVLQHVDQMIVDGAKIIDVGAESTRPYAQRVSVQEELDRLMTMLMLIKERFDVIISVDTCKSEVMESALRLGVHLINDIRALTAPNAIKLLADNSAAICLMHMQMTPEVMQDAPAYENVVAEVTDFLTQRVKKCLAAGIEKNRLIIDPGFGFGKKTVHNVTLLRNISQFKSLGLPILVGLSRKACIGELLSLPVKDRLYGSLAAHVIAAMAGAAIIRTHDVKPTVEALKIAEAVLAGRSSTHITHE